MDQDSERGKNLRTLLELHWEHCRHIEYERLWFLITYVGVVATVLAFMKKPLPTMWPKGFLIALSFLGFILTIRWTYAFEQHRSRVRMIIKELKVGEGLDMDIPLKGFLVLAGRTRYLYPWIYILILGMILAYYWS